MGDRWGEFGITCWAGDWALASCDEPALDVAILIRPLDGVPQVLGLQVGPPGSLDTGGRLPEGVGEGLRQLSGLGPDGNPWPPVVLSSDLWRSLPVARLKAAALAHRRRLFSFTPVGEPAKGPAPLPAARFEQVAEIYEQAAAAGLSPISAVMSAYPGLSRGGARRYIRIARERGLLGWPTKGGIAGFESPKPPYRRRPVW